MKFRTEYTAGRDASLTLSPRQPLALVGSCFADNIGARARRCMWDAGNPLGVLFNPLSIADALELCLLAENPAARFADTLFEAGGVWHSWMFDSGVSALTPRDCRNIFEERRLRLQDAVGQSGCLFVTFGTAWCYFLADGRDTAGRAGMPGRVVANCHKMPQRMFERRRVSAEDISARWRVLMDRLRELCPGLRVIFTVSPVRHVRDGLHENALSKATLLLAVDSLCAADRMCGYFPAYEIVNDDLRDYRFYASDLVHPSEEAVEYIWEAFQTTYLDDAGRRRLREGESLRRRMDHRPLIPDAPGADAFRAETDRLLARFNGSEH